ncbi:MAG: acyl-CoA thioesterase, partial [Cyanobacteria bacterium J06642_11]
MPSSAESFPSPYLHHHVIRFHETDAAGVVYFANILTLCHEAYEASLAAAGMNVRLFFGGGALAVPVVHGSVDFRRPLYCGDEVEIALGIASRICVEAACDSHLHLSPGAGDIANVQGHERGRAI